MDQQLVREPAEVHAEAGRQRHRGADAGDVRQSAHDRRLGRALETLVIACHCSASCLEKERRPEPGQLAGYPTWTAMAVEPPFPSIPERHALDRPCPDGRR